MSSCVPLMKKLIVLINIDQFLSKPLLRKLPYFPGVIMDYSDVLEEAYSSSIFSYNLSLIVSEVMRKSFTQIAGGETETLGNIDILIKKFIELAKGYADNCSDLELNRNKTIKSSTTTTANRRDRPNMTIYYKNVLLIMGEENDLDTKLEEAENQLDSYFDYWNPLAFSRLPFVMAFVAASIKLQFYYYYLGNEDKPVRVRISNAINLGTPN